MMMPRTRKKTRSINSLAEARNVCSKIFRPDECLVNLNSLTMIMAMMVVIIMLMIRMINKEDQHGQMLLQLEQPDDDDGGEE